MRHLLLIITACGLFTAQAQNNHSIGIGYFGETLTYPGIVLEYENEFVQSEKIGWIVKSDFGFYNHPRNHQAFFIEEQVGLRRYLGAKLFIENSIGVGVMLPVLNAPVYKVTEQGEVAESGKAMNLDFMPSYSLGIGYVFNSDSHRDAVWLRPKIFWQYPYNTLALPHVAVQIGITHTFKTK